MRGPDSSRPPNTFPWTVVQQQRSTAWALSCPALQKGRPGAPPASGTPVTPPGSLEWLPARLPLVPQSHLDAAASCCSGQVSGAFSVSLPVMCGVRTAPAGGDASTARGFVPRGWDAPEGARQRSTPRVGLGHKGLLRAVAGVLGPEAPTWLWKGGAGRPPEAMPAGPLQGVSAGVRAVQTMRENTPPQRRPAGNKAKTQGHRPSWPQPSGEPCPEPASSALVTQGPQKSPSALHPGLAGDLSSSFGEPHTVPGRRDPCPGLPWK